MSRKRVTLSHLPRPCCDLLVLIRNTAPSFAMVRPGKDTPPYNRTWVLQYPCWNQGALRFPAELLAPQPGAGRNHDGSVSPESEEAKATPKRLRKREWTKPT